MPALKLQFLPSLPGPEAKRRNVLWRFSLVMAYVFGFMVIVSAYEAVARPKVTYPGMFQKAIISMGPLAEMIFCFCVTWNKKGGSFG